MEVRRIGKEGEERRVIQERQEKECGARMRRKRGEEVIYQAY